MTADPDSRQPRLVVAPERPSLDTELHLRLVNLPPGVQVTLRASLGDPRGREWRSWATFRAAADAPSTCAATHQPKAATAASTRWA